jgi:exoribonuclease-2
MTDETTHQDGLHHRSLLQEIARTAMLDRGLLPDFSPKVLDELEHITASERKPGQSVRDLRNLLWCSIDNDDSKDLDQLTVAEKLNNGFLKVLVAVADVDAMVRKSTAIDNHAAQNTTTVYTAAAIFPMIPLKLSTDLTSLNFESDRLALVIEMVIDQEGVLKGSDIYRAWVRNQAKLCYDNLSEWLENKGPIPEEAARIPGLADNLKLQDQAAQKLKDFRHEQGALDFITIKASPVFDGDRISDLKTEWKNRTREIIEDFMVCANGITASYLTSRHFPSFRRVVKTPKRWSRIVEIAEEEGYKLPAEPDSKSLQEFLTYSKKNDLLHFPDLSISIIKLLGSGEYEVGFPGEKTSGHFGLAVQNYSHSTAPNRRYPDLITHRLLKAALSGQEIPYSPEDLVALASHCTQKEDDAKKVERQVGKSAAALLLENRIGENFDAIVTGAADKGTWVRLLHLPVEGRLIEGFHGLDIGHRIRVELVATDIWHGFIDFRKI